MEGQGGGVGTPCHLPNALLSPPYSLGQILPRFLTGDNAISHGPSTQWCWWQEGVRAEGLC